MILLNTSRGYAGYPAGTIVQLQTVEEASVIGQGFATSSVGPVTAGNVTTNKIMGRVGIAAAGTQVVVFNPQFTTESKFNSYLSNAAADATTVYVTRTIPAAGSVTFVLNAASTGVVAIDWYQVLLSGETQVS